MAALADPAVGAVLAMAIAIVSERMRKRCRSCCYPCHLSRLHTHATQSQHNIPEGLCVALPIYYATGSRWKAFGWAVLSGLSEPIAALLGWAILVNSFSDTLYGVLFGIVTGMMVIISIKELLPTAQRYDPGTFDIERRCRVGWTGRLDRICFLTTIVCRLDDEVTNVAFIIGMAVIAVSLVLFVA